MTPHLETIGLTEIPQMFPAFGADHGAHNARWPARLGAGPAVSTDSGKRLLIAWLVSRVDDRDPVSRGHSWRVSRLVQVVADTLALRGRAREELIEGALLHDVGKIAIPRELLNRPGPLSTDEFSVVQRHAEIGGSMLAKIPALAHAAPIARWHHERWDGTGYPGSLSQAQVPFGARVVAVLDALDAMTSRRAYSAPKPLHAAIAELRAHAGSQFDPEIVRMVTSIEWSQTIAEFEQKPAMNLCNAPKNA